MWNESVGLDLKLHRNILDNNHLLIILYMCPAIDCQSHHIYTHIRTYGRMSSSVNLSQIFGPWAEQKPEYPDKTYKHGEKGQSNQTTLKSHTSDPLGHCAAHILHASTFVFIKSGSAIFYIAPQKFLRIKWKINSDPFAPCSDLRALFVGTARNQYAECWSKWDTVECSSLSVFIWIVIRNPIIDLNRYISRFFLPEDKKKPFFTQHY